MIIDNISNDTPIAILTVGQLKELLNSSLKNIEKDSTVVKKDFSAEKYVYGLRGIRELFNVSHATAQKYKDGILKEAVTQFGRKIIVDKEKALKLFAEKGGVNHGE